jgi:hypothetical protein
MDSARRLAVSRWCLSLAVGLTGLSLAAFVTSVAVLPPRIVPLPAERADESFPEPAPGRPADPPAAAGELRPGLLGEYHDVGERLEDFPPPAARPRPTLTRVDPQINFARTYDDFARTGLRDYFYVRWSGVLRVPRDGRYAFWLLSDDGSRLRIDGKSVVDNGGLHEMKEERGEADLAAGDHEIVIEFFDNSGHTGISLSWEAEGLEKDVVPERALFHRGGRP